MRSRGSTTGPASTRVLEAASLVAPILAALAILVYFATSEGGASSAASRSVANATAGPRSIAVRGKDAPTSGRAPYAVVPPAGSRGHPQVAPTTDSQIVWVRRGASVDLLDAPRGEPIGTQGATTEFGSPSVFSVQAHTPHWLGVSTPLASNGSLAWIRGDSSDLRLGYVRFSIDVDLSERSASLSRGDVEVRTWPVTVGAADSPTPTGTFAVTDTFRGGLPSAYGCCALALSATQPNLPSGWFGGNRIAIHATDGPPGLAASAGCIRSRDADVRALIDLVPLGTPVTIHS